MERSKLFDSYNAGYAQLLYERYLRDPSSVDEGWRRLFTSEAAAESGLITVPGEPADAPTRVQVRAAMAAAELVDAYRLHGHLAAALDPLGGEAVGHPMLDPAFHHITREDLEGISASLLGMSVRGETMAAVLEWLQATYCGAIGYEFEHLEDPERREWLRERIESGEARAPLSVEEKRRLLVRLSEVESLEQFLHRAYLGQKRFSGEGTDMLVAMLDLAIERAAATGASEVVLGMAHRGRLNVLAHVLGRPYAALIAEFEGQHAQFGSSGDVKYHMGAEGTYATASGYPLTVTLAPNPSHLEFVNPIVEGMARAKQSRREGRELTRDPAAVVPILIHGDAAFAGQGVVAETLNFAQLEGYTTGGTLHLIVNNQVGFTTDPEEGRSTRHASDLARGFGVPIFHVNADDPEACLAVVRLAMAYRETFHADVLIDLIGYRRYGHNEGDEPAYTQPLMYQIIADHPPVGKIWADALVATGVITREEAAAAWQSAHQRLVEAQQAVQAAAEDHAARMEEHAPPEEPPTPTIETAVPADKLHSYDRELHTWPADFQVNAKLARQLEKRAKVLAEDGAIDWGHAESLAFASLLADGVAIRLSGQDSERGTFSHRHLVLHDARTGAVYSPLAGLEEARAPFEVYNSPLSEIGVLGFEYGYGAAAPDDLVLWEAQFGDFVNAAQVIVDQFIAAGYAKWGQRSRLVLLLPHGFEGQGPEHSSARLERFLQLSAEHNMRVANCTTPAQYFHLLRRQGLLEQRHPLIIMTPKSLLRHPRATSRLEELVRGTFRPLLDDDVAAHRAGEITRLVLCSGKLYYELLGAGEQEQVRTTAIARIEQLYPFPYDELAALLERYSALEELIWAQEEPENMGGWRFVEPRLRRLAAERARVRYVGRPERASPAEGQHSTHEREQARIVTAAIAVPATAARRAPSEKQSRH